MTRRNKLAAVTLGVFVGFVLGVTSAGSGSLIAVGLILLFRLAPKEVVATDVFHAAILLWAAAIAHIVAGNVDYGLALNILVGSLPGVWIGSHLVTKVEVTTLRTALAIVLVGSGLGLLSKAGAGIPPRRDRRGAGGARRGCGVAGAQAPRRAAAGAAGPPGGSARQLTGIDLR